MDEISNLSLKLCKKMICVFAPLVMFYEQIHLDFAARTATTFSGTVTVLGRLRGLHLQLMIFL